jgi:hypothetical protein
VVDGNSHSVPHLFGAKQKSLNREGRKGYAKDAKKGTSQQLSAISHQLPAISYQPGHVFSFR